MSYFGPPQLGLTPSALTRQEANLLTSELWGGRSSFSPPRSGVSPNAVLAGLEVGGPANAAARSSSSTATSGSSPVVSSTFALAMSPLRHQHMHGVVRVVGSAGCAGCCIVHEESDRSKIVSLEQDRRCAIYLTAVQEAHRRGLKWRQECREAQKNVTTIRSSASTMVAKARLCTELEETLRVRVGQLHEATRLAEQREHHIDRLHLLFQVSGQVNGLMAQTLLDFFAEREQMTLIYFVHREGLILESRRGLAWVYVGEWKVVQTENKRLVAQCDELRRQCESVRNAMQSSASAVEQRESSWQLERQALISDRLHLASDLKVASEGSTDARSKIATLRQAIADLHTTVTSTMQHVMQYERNRPPVLILDRVDENVDSNSASANALSIAPHLSMLQTADCAIRSLLKLLQLTANKAREFESSQQSLSRTRESQEAQIEDLTKQVAALNERNGDLATRLEESKRSLRDVRGTLQDSQEKRASMQIECANLSEEVAQMRKTIADLQTALRSKEAETVSYRKEVESSRLKISELALQVSELHGTAESHHRMSETFQKEKARLEDQWKASYERLEEERSLLQKNNAQLLKDHLDLKETYAADRRKWQSERAEFELTLETRLEQQRASLSKAHEQSRQELERAIAELQKTLEETRMMHEQDRDKVWRESLRTLREEQQRQWEATQLELNSSHMSKLAQDREQEWAELQKQMDGERARNREAAEAELAQWRAEQRATIQRELDGLRATFAAEQEAETEAWALKKKSESQNLEKELSILQTESTKQMEQEREAARKQWRLEWETEKTQLRTKEQQQLHEELARRRKELESEVHAANVVLTSQLTKQWADIGETWRIECERTFEADCAALRVALEDQLNELRVHSRNELARAIRSQEAESRAAIAALTLQKDEQLNARIQEAKRMEQEFLQLKAMAQHEFVETLATMVEDFRNRVSQACQTAQTINDQRLIEERAGWKMRETSLLAELQERIAALKSQSETLQQTTEETLAQQTLVSELRAQIKDIESGIALAVVGVGLARDEANLQKQESWRESLHRLKAAAMEANRLRAALEEAEQRIQLVEMQLQMAEKKEIQFDEERKAMHKVHSESVTRMLHEENTAVQRLTETLNSERANWVAEQQQLVHSHQEILTALQSRIATLTASLETAQQKLQEPCPQCEGYAGQIEQLSHVQLQLQEELDTAYKQMSALNLRVKESEQVLIELETERTHRMTLEKQLSEVHAQMEELHQRQQMLSAAAAGKSSEPCGQCEKYVTQIHDYVTEVQKHGLAQVQMQQQIESAYKQIDVLTQRIREYEKLEITLETERTQRLLLEKRLSELMIVKSPSVATGSYVELRIVANVSNLSELHLQSNHIWWQNVSFSASSGGPISSATASPEQSPGRRLSRSSYDGRADSMMINSTAWLPQWSQHDASGAGGGAVFASAPADLSQLLSCSEQSGQPVLAERFFIVGMNVISERGTLQITSVASEINQWHAVITFFDKTPPLSDQYTFVLKIYIPPVVAEGEICCSQCLGTAEQSQQMIVNEGRLRARIQELELENRKLTTEPISPTLGRVGSSTFGSFTQSLGSSPSTKKLIPPPASQRPPWIGCTVVDQNATSDDDNLVIKDIKPGGPADKAGLKNNDELITLMNVKITSLEVFRATYRKNAAVGRPMPIAIRRHGSATKVFKLVPEEAPLKPEEVAASSSPTPWESTSTPRETRSSSVISDTNPAMLAGAVQDTPRKLLNEQEALIGDLRDRIATLERTCLDLTVERDALKERLMTAAAASSPNLSSSSNERVMELEARLASNEVTIARLRSSLTREERVSLSNVEEASRWCIVQLELNARQFLLSYWQQNPAEALESMVLSEFGDTSVGGAGGLQNTG